MSKALSSKAQNFKQKAGLLTRSTPIAFPFTLFQQWQQDISVSFYELTAAGLFWIFTKFPFNLCTREPFASAKVYNNLISTKFYLFFIEKKERLFV